MLTIVVIGLMISSLWSSYGHVLAANSDFSTASLLSDTNAQRLSANESSLTLDAKLSAAAQAKASDMVTHDYWSHDTPDGRTPWSFIAAAGYSYSLAGENLAYGFADANETITGWMNSAEHRANILNSGYQNVGFGIASSPHYLGQGAETVVVAEYAAPAAASAASSTFSGPTSADSTMAPLGQPAQLELSAQPVSRIQLLTGGRTAWSALVLVAVTGAAASLLLMRHGWYWRRWAVRGEAYISHHPLLDILMACLVSAGFVLTRSSGIIR